MLKQEKLVLLNWANQLSDQELRKEYCNAINILADAIENNHYFDVPYPDSLEERVNLLGKICTERGISIW